MASSSRAVRSIGIFLGGILFAVVLSLVAGYLYLKFGHAPVATADESLPLERQVTHIALNARIDREMVAPPFAASEDDFKSGAHIYIEHCAICHGTPSHDSPIAKSMFPGSPQLWKKNRRGIVGVSDDKPGKVHWFVVNGVRLSGMPAFDHILNKTEMWQVSLLLQKAGQTLPAETIEILASGSTN